MKLFMPSIGTKIRLIAPWTFSLHNDWRNKSLWNVVVEPHLSRYAFSSMSDAELNHYGVIRTIVSHGTWNDTIYTKNVEFPVDTELSIARIYIRQNKQHYDSISFRLLSKTINGVFRRGHIRFWAKLPDTFNMEFDII